MITRENYEEFFLLYVDDEMPAAERLAVERFVSANPDLQEELDALLQCRIQPEADATFPDKNSLLQYEESFLSYVDGELDAAGRLAVEELVRGDAGKARELQTLLLTVSQPDTAVVCPDKESLYHRRRRIVLMPWLQVGAAAAVLAVVVVLALPRHQALPGTATAVTSPPVSKNKVVPVTPADTSTLHSYKKDVLKPVYAATPEAPRKTLPAPVVVKAVPDRSEEVAVNDPKSPEQIVSGSAGSGSKTGMLATIGQDQVHNRDNANAAVTTIAVVNIPKDQSSFATQALLREQESGKNDMADNLSTPAGKTKLRGLFRRVTRAFGKTADRDDDGQRQVLISAFQVALK